MNQKMDRYKYRVVVTIGDWILDIKYKTIRQLSKEIFPDDELVN